ncbi:MAG: Hsp20/alpha crystallin family protein [Candidatus Micrarchaeota archaeon]|nr:Hsp20/alpha crystallin family protein [Candidatus Micrarchaeota archaeon]
MARRKGANDQNGSSPDDINAFINKLFNEIIESNGIPPGPGNVYRFDVSVNNDGITITPNASRQVQSVKMDTKEPLVDVIERRDGTTVISELPGVAKKEIELHADHEKLSIKAGTGKTTYSKLVPLPSMVDPTSASAIYNNGVLEVTFKKSGTYSSIVRITVK